MTLPRYTQVAAAVIWRGEELLLVRQQGTHDPAPSWALPGGVVEPGELPTEAMVREVREETGLDVLNPGRLLYVNAEADAAGTSRGTAFVFEVAEWRGTLLSADPDDVILQVRFFPVAEAVEKLEALPFAAMREPIVAHLRGAAEPGALWLFRHNADGSATLVGRVPGG